MARKRTFFIASAVVGLLAAGAGAFLITAPTANAVTGSRVVQERTITLKANQQGTYTHTILDDWRGHVLTVWLIPSGEGCWFDVPRAWYTTDEGDRYKYVLRNQSDKTCTTTVQIVATPPLFEAGVTGTLQPGQTSRPFVFYDSRDHLVWLAGIRTTTVGCTLELERVWYERKPGQSRSFAFTIRNRGSVACSGRALVTHFENTQKIATKKPGGQPTHYYTQLPGARPQATILGYSPAPGQTCTVGTSTEAYHVQRPIGQSANHTSWAALPSSVQCEFSTYLVTLT